MVGVAGILLNGTLACVSQLRAQLSECGQKYAQAHGLAHQLSYGGVPAVVFETTAGTETSFPPAIAPYCGIRSGAAAWRSRIRNPSPCLAQTAAGANSIPATALTRCS